MATRRIEKKQDQSNDQNHDASSEQIRFNTGRRRRAESGTEIFSKTFQKTNVWLREIAQELETDDPHRAYVSLRAVLQTLRDRLPLKEAIELGSQLPMLVRGFYYERWNALDLPIKYNREEFVSQVESYFENESGIDPNEVIRAVLIVLNRYISEGQMRDVRVSFPKEIRELFEIYEEQPVS